MPGTTIESAEGGKAKPADRPLSSLLMQIATFDTSAGITQHLVQVEALVKAERLVQPLLDADAPSAGGLANVGGAAISSRFLHLFVHDLEIGRPPVGAAPPVIHDNTPACSCRA